MELLVISIDSNSLDCGRKTTSVDSFKDCTRYGIHDVLTSVSIVTFGLLLSLSLSLSPFALI